MINPHTPRYKRGTITKDGKLYGRYPDGSLYRIYSTSDRPFLQIVDRKGETFLQFDLPPTHEAAMFLKTVLQIFMERYDGWDKGIEWAERELSYHRPAIVRLYKKFKENPKKLDVEYWRGFYKMYKWNLERQKDAN